ncbi:hypothetical protein Nepgr_011956 [Nepenthes gracilis]|uniref:DUF7953 domain-containing protein n=1 Tax=Nepenthes gracilis TaxID=150966 RepID=A0AAD3SF08_NEPGR|nr:hypothetical protein Nepgr_011956 [Nepenthes gracilis]
MWSRCSVNNSRSSAVNLLCFFTLTCFPGYILSAVVTLQSIQIYKTHEWLKAIPTVYFSCKGENKTILPDVKEANVLYNFKGEESWQPLTELLSKKCKRCGFYEQDLFKDDIFDEWELCPSDFTAPDGKYTHVKDGELNATLICPECTTLAGDTEAGDASDSRGKRIHTVIIILISIAVTIVVIVGLLLSCKYWQKRKRQQEQARFLKLFEEGDNMEDELGLEDVL